MTPFAPVSTSLRHFGVADAGENVVGLLGHLGGGAAGDGFFFGSELLRFARRVRPNGYLMAGFRQIPRHRITHETQSKKSKLCHTRKW